MSREIKFRAWDKEHNAMRFPGFASSLKFDEETCDMDSGTIDYGEYVPPKSIEWMQFTGLKDKDGKEIYEGDLIVSNEGRYLSSRPDQIIWSKERAAFCFSSAPRTPIGGNKNRILDISSNSVVIGNVYENPELAEMKP